MLQYRNSAASKNVTLNSATSHKAALIRCDIKKCNIK